MTLAFFAADMGAQKLFKTGRFSTIAVLVLLGCGITLASRGRSDQELPPIFFSVDSALHLDRSWADAACKLLLDLARESQSRSECSWVSDPALMSGSFRDPIAEAERSRFYGYHLQLREKERSNYLVTIHNWNPAESQIGEFSRTFHAETDEELKRGVSTFFSDYLLANTRVSPVRQPGPHSKYSAVLTDPRLRDLLRRELSEKDLAEFDATTKIAFASSEEISAGKEQPYTILIGGGSSASAADTTGAPDLRAAVKVAGSNIDYTYLVSPDLRIRMAVDFSGNVAIVRSYALDSGKTPVDDTSSDYYYAWGLSSGSNIAVESGNLSTGLSMRVNNFNSLSPALTHVIPVASQKLGLADSKTSQELWVSYKLKSFKIRVYFSQLDRSGSAASGSSISRTETVHGGSLIYQY